MPSRTRTTGSPHVPTYVAGFVTQTRVSGSPTTTNFNGSRVGVYERMDDFVTPGFRRLSASGKIINSAMSRQRFTYTASPSTYMFTDSPPSVGTPLIVTQTQFNDFGQALGPLKPPEHPTVPTGHLLYNWSTLLDEDALTSRAATAALADSNGKSAQGLVILAEMQKTLDTLRNPLKAFRQAMAKAPKIIRNHSASAGSKTMGSLKNAAQGASSQYLTWFYGIRTVMFDIEEVLEALETKVITRATGRGFAKDEITGTPSNQTAPYSSHKFTARTTYFERLEVRAGALVELSGHSTASNLGLSVRKIPEAIWEMTPWSFVVDWFLNVQSTIGALEALVNNNFLAQWLTVKRTIIYERSVVPGSHAVVPGVAPFRTLNSTCQDRDKVVVEMYNRVPLTLSRFVRPTLNFSLNKVPTLAAISLAVQQLTKR